MDTSNGVKPILEIYKEYKIMPNLAEHQLRVAGVAALVCENLTLAPPPSPRGRGGM